MKRTKNRIYPPPYSDIRIDHAKGVYLFDKVNKKRYLDFSASAGAAIVGYGNARITAAIKMQADKLIVSPQKHKTRESEKLCDKILSLFPKEYNTVMPAVTGSESVEIAVQVAISYTERTKILSWNNAYHGHTIATRSLGEKDARLEYMRNRFINIKPPSNMIEAGQQLINIEKKLRTEKFAAFITEGVITNAGFQIFPRGFLKKIVSLCKKHKTLLVCDEVLTGFGRTGKMFAFEHQKIKPDIICLAKGLASGHASISAVVTRGEFISGYDYFSTYAWTPLACATAAVNIDLIKSQKLPHNSEVLGKYALFILKRKLINCPLVYKIKGVGLGVSLKFNTRDETIRVHELCLRRGVLLFRNINLNMLFIMPPLIITKQQLKAGLKVVISVIADEYKGYYDKI